MFETIVQDLACRLPTRFLILQTHTVLSIDREGGTIQISRRPYNTTYYCSCTKFVVSASMKIENELSFRVCKQQ